MGADENQYYGAGMTVTRMVDGEIERLDSLKPEVVARIIMLERMSKRWDKYTAAGNRKALLRLANEYEKKFMPTLAKKIRKEAGGIPPGRGAKKGQKKGKGKAGVKKCYNF